MAVSLPPLILSVPPGRSNPSEARIAFGSGRSSSIHLSPSTSSCKALPCLLPPHYARGAIHATLTPFCSASHPGRASQTLPRPSGSVAFLVNGPYRVRQKLKLL